VEDEYGDESDGEPRCNMTPLNILSNLFLHEKYEQKILKGLFFPFCILSLVNPVNPKYPEWYAPGHDMEHSIQICRGERVK